MLLEAIQEMVIEVLNCKCEQYDSEQLSISLTCVGSISLQMLEREIVSFSEWWCVVVWVCLFVCFSGCFLFVFVFKKKQMPSVKDGTTQGRNILKKGPITLRSVSAPKVKMVPPVLPLKRGCENKTISTIKAPSRKGAVLSSSSGKRIFHRNTTT